ncbi:MAG: threonine synthase [Oscillospiraceae bacterium]|nr:threonine synthase [Ruminococcus sp.]MDY6061619.1 threonine synthase [Oscillospiraceae bacterium]
MLYTSTRDKSIKVESADAIAHGISEEGGLFIPVEIPKISKDDINELVGMDYIGRAKKILSLYLTDFSEDEIDYCVNGAYAKGKFSDEKIAPLHTLSDKAEILELWKGPTCAFKDMALQLLPYLLTVAAKKSAPDKKIVILVATSGDTGKAALEGFKDVPGTKILVFYPEDGVSPMQKLQMITQEGENVAVCAIEGNFDDAQNGVKAIFTDKEVAKKLDGMGMMFSSANSINWGRLVPQIVYYVSAYCDMLSKGKIKMGDEINVVVPTGNFGNILAAYYAKEMGVPIKKLICASNSNDVLTEFLKTGVYNRVRDFYTTISPSMDILISSNLERLLFLLSSMDDVKVNAWMKELKESGKYHVGDEVLSKIKAVFEAGCCNDEKTKATIAEVFEEKKYLCDTHTAVAVAVYEDYIAQSGDSTPTVIASTANPFKFSASVLDAVRPGMTEGMNEFDMVLGLHVETGADCPPQLANLKDKTPRFTGCCKKEDMEKVVFDMLSK